MTFDPKHPLLGKPSVDGQQAGYWIWVADNNWHVRMTPGGRSHRFQGSLAGVRGSVAELMTTRPELKSSIALVGDAVQFDVESASSASGDAADGFDAHVVGGCARFELMIDGKVRPELVRLGPRLIPARHVPFERCP
jgi:hypothetical protein